MPKKDVILIATITGAMLLLATGGIVALIVQSGGFTDRPEDAPKLVAEGDLRMMEYDYYGAIEAYDRAIEVNPNLIEAYLSRAAAHVTMSNYHDAMADYETVVARSTSKADIAAAHIGLATMRMALSDPAGALAILTALLETNPADSEARTLRAQAFAALGRTDEALEDYEALIDDRTSTPDVVLLEQRAMLRYEAGDLEGAAADLKRIIDTGYGYFPELMNRRGDILRALGRFDEAANDLKTAWEWNPDDHNVGRSYAWALWDAGRYEEAAKVHDQLVRDPRRAELHDHFSQGVGFFNVGKYDEALTPLETAVRTSASEYEYASLFRFICAALADDAESARDALAAAFDAYAAHWRPFAREIGSFLLGRQTEDELLQATRNLSHGLTDAQAECEATFYIGAKRLIEGDEAEAVKFFERCVETGVHDYYEFQAAQAQLRLRDEDSAIEETP